MHRRHAVTFTIAAAALACACSSTGEHPDEAAPLSGSGQDGAVHWLFVQGAGSGRFSGDELVLERPAPTVFFSDRPVRIDGHMSTERFVGAWGAGADSFASDPPNAVLSILDDDRTPAVVELREPTLTDDAVRFRVEVQSGEIPASFGQAALFIDSLGLAGPTLGLGLHGSASSALQDPRLDLPMRQAYYRAFAPDQADPLNPNLVPRQDHEEGYHFANDENGPPQLGLTAPHRDLSRYYGD